jgi:hypothetical protein
MQKKLAILYVLLATSLLGYAACRYQQKPATLNDFWAMEQGTTARVKVIVNISQHQPYQDRLRLDLVDYYDPWRYASAWVESNTELGQRLTRTLAPGTRVLELDLVKESGPLDLLSIRVAGD